MRSTNVVYSCQSVTRLTESQMAFVGPHPGLQASWHASGRVELIPAE
jgi:hypothetical protein